MIRESIGALIEGRSMTSEEASACMEEIMSGTATPAQIGAFVTALRLKGETSDEIAGMARVMRANVLRVKRAGAGGRHRRHGRRRPQHLQPLDGGRRWCWRRRG